MKQYFQDWHWNSRFFSERRMEFKNNFISERSQFTPNQVRDRRGNAGESEANKQTTVVSSQWIDSLS